MEFYIVVNNVTLNATVVTSVFSQIELDDFNKNLLESTQNIQVSDASVTK